MKRCSRILIFTASHFCLNPCVVKEATALRSKLEASKDPLLWADLYARPA
jgi:hypothetical protein